MQLDAPTQSPGMGGNQANTRIHCGFVVGRRLDPNEFLDEADQRGLLAPGTGQQGAHGGGNIGRTEHFETFQGIPRG
jgi:hypothetical protein